MADVSANFPQPVSRQTLAELLTLTAQRVDQLVREGWIEKPSRGNYALVAGVQGYIRFLKDDERRSSKTAAESRVRDMRADEIALRIEERSKKLINEARAEALGLVDEVIGGLKADLYALPARVTKDLSLRRVIEEAIEDALAASARRAAEGAPAKPRATSRRQSSKHKQRRSP